MVVAKDSVGTIVQHHEEEPEAASRQDRTLTETTWLGQKLA